jgi:iron complex outermembrane receptor protein
MSIKLRLLATVAAVATVGLWAGSAAADDQASSAGSAAASSASAGPDTARVGEVVVTARLLKENIQKAPVAVTAVTPTQLQQLHLHDLSDLNHIAPNFTILPTAALFRTSLIGFARGIGYNNIDGTVDPALGVSVDGVFYLRNVGVLQDMYDLQGVEIVAGPQGTLYGKNTLAGTLNLTTHKPDLGEYEASGTLRFGNLGRRDSELIANVPLSDTVAVRFAFQSQHSDGPYTNVATIPGGGPPNGIHVGGDQSWTLRSSLRWSPSDKFDLTLISTELWNRSDSVGGTNESTPCSVGALALGHPGVGYPAGTCFGVLPYTAGFSSVYTVQRTWPSADYFNLSGITADLRYHAKGFDLISITNYTDDTSPTNYDDFSYTGIFNNYAVVKHHQYSEDLRAQSTGSGPIQWVAGFYTDYGWYDYWESLNFFGSFISNWTQQSARSFSGYGQVSYAVTPQLQLTAGVRLMTETKNATEWVLIPGFHHDMADWPASDIVTGRKTWNNYPYHFDGKYQFTDDLMGYVSYSTGVLAGGFSSAPSAATFPPCSPASLTCLPPGNAALSAAPWSPETARSVELGIKSSWFDHRLQLNLIGFNVHYDDLQSYRFVQFYTGGFGGIVIGPSNAGHEVANGVEFQAAAVPIENLHLSTSVGYLDARWTSFTSFTAGQQIDCTIQHFDPLVGVVPGACVPQLSPHWTAHVGATYDFHTDVGTFTPTLNYSYTSDYFTDLFNNPYQRIPAYGLVDLSLNYQDPSGRWMLSLWSHNIGDVRYALGAEDLGGSGFPGTRTKFYADPRTFGVELHMKLEQPR